MTIHIEPYANRFFAIYVDGALLAVTVYKNGARAIGAKLEAMETAHQVVAEAEAIATCASQKEATP